MNKKKKMFVMKETLVDLTPYLLREAQGADCGLCSGITNWQLSDAGSCNPCNTLRTIVKTN